MTRYLPRVGLLARPKSLLRHLSSRADATVAPAKHERWLLPDLTYLRPQRSRYAADTFAAGRLTFLPSLTRSKVTLPFATSTDTTFASKAPLPCL